MPCLRGTSPVYGGRLSSAHGGGKNSGKGVYGGDTHPGIIHAWKLSWLTPLTSVQLLNPAGTHAA